MLLRYRIYCLVPFNRLLEWHRIVSGQKKIIAVGAIAYALGLFLTATAVASSTLYFSLGALIGLGLSCTSYVVVLGAVAKVVPAQHAAKAFGLTTAAGSFGMFAMIPGAQHLLNNYGWQEALTTFAMLCGLMAAFSVFMKEASSSAQVQGREDDQQTLKQALREAFSHKGYWLIHAGFFVCGFHVMFIATHLPSYLADKHLPASTAAMALAYVGIFNIFGSYFWGVMGDRFSKRHVMSALYLFRTAVITAFVTLPVTEYTAAIFGGAIGFCWLEQCR